MVQDIIIIYNIMVLYFIYYSFLPFKTEKLFIQF